MYRGRRRPWPRDYQDDYRDANHRRRRYDDDRYAAKPPREYDFVKQERYDEDSCTLYVGNIPANIPGEELLQILNRALGQAGGTEGGAVSYRMNLDKRYCYIQFRTRYDAEEALNLNLLLHGEELTIRPLNDYDRKQLFGLEPTGSPYREIQNKIEPPSDENWMRTVHYSKEEDMNMPGPSTQRVIPIKPDEIEPLAPVLHEEVEIEHPPFSIKQSRKVRVRHVPPGVTEEEMMEFFNCLLKLSGYADNMAVSCRMTNDVAIIQFKDPRHVKQAVDFSPLKFKDVYLLIEPVGDEAGTKIKTEPFDMEKDEEMQGSDFNEEEDEEDNKEVHEEDIVSGPETNNDRTILVENVHAVTPKQFVKFITRRIVAAKLMSGPGVVKVTKAEKDFYSVVQFDTPGHATAALHLYGTNYRGHVLKVVPLTRDVLAKPGSIKDFTSSFDDKVVISNLPRYMNRKYLRTFLEATMARKGLTKVRRPIMGMTRAVLRHVFALTFRSIKNATRALKLDGLEYGGKTLRFRRPDVCPKNTSISKDSSAIVTKAAAPAVVKPAPALPSSQDDSYHIRVINHARHVTEEQLRAFLNQEMHANSLNLYPGDSIWPAKIITYHTSAFAFAIFRSADDATKGLALNGVKYEGHVLRVTRPRDYEPLTEEESKKLPVVPQKKIKNTAKKLKRKNPELFENGPGYTSKGIPLHPAYKLFIGDLSEDVNSNNFREFLNKKMREKMASEYNSVKAVRIHLAASSMLFQVRSFWEAKSAVTYLDGTMHEGHKLRVKFFNLNTLNSAAGSVQPSHEAEKAAKPPPALNPEVSSQKTANPSPVVNPSNSSQNATIPSPAVNHEISNPPQVGQNPPKGATTEKAPTVPKRETQISYHRYQEPNSSQSYNPTVQRYNHPVQNYNSAIQNYNPPIQRYNPPVQNYNPGHLVTFQANSFSNKLTWSISTWNVMGTVTNSTVRAYMDETLFNLGMDVIAVQETGLPTGTFYTKNYKWYMSNSEDGTAPGVGFLLRRDLLPCAFEFNTKGGNLAHMQIKTIHQNLALVSVYVPWDTDPQAPTIMDELKSFVSTLCPQDHILLLGDFKAEIGKSDLTYDDKGVIGEFLSHNVCNKNGIKLKEILHQFKMFLFSTLQDSTLYTWYNGVKYTQTDHVIANCDHLITSVRGIPMSSFETFHKLLRSSVRFTACDRHYT